MARRPRITRGWSKLGIIGDVRTIRLVPSCGVRGPTVPYSPSAAELPVHVEHGADARRDGSCVIISKPANAVWTY
jgi:hypothetical protein